MMPAGTVRPTSPCCGTVGTSQLNRGSSGAAVAAVAEVAAAEAAEPSRIAAEVVLCVAALEVAPPWFCVWRKKRKRKRKKKRFCFCLFGWLVW